MARKASSHRTRSRILADPGNRLASYNPENRPWHEIPDDGYLYDHLADLLLAAGREDDLVALFGDDQWMRARFEQSSCTYTGFLGDLMAAWQGVVQPRAADAGTLVQCARFALIRGAITTLCVGEVRIPPAPPRPTYAGAPRLVVARKEAAFNRAFRDASRHGIDRVLDAGLALDDESERAHALVLLGPSLRDEHAARALEAALTMENAYYRARAVGALVPHVTGPTLERALSAGPSVSSLPRKGLALSSVWQIAVAPALRFLSPAWELPRRLKRWLAIFGLARSKKKYRPAARACLTPGKTGQAARATLVDVNDLRLLEALLPHLSRTLLARTLEEVIAHSCEGGKARAIPWFAPYADEALMRRALEGALLLEYEGDRASALRGLALYLPVALRPRALAAARAIENAQFRAETLLALLPHAGRETPILIREIRDAVGEWLLDEQNCTFDDIVLLCLDAALFGPPVLDRRAVIDLHHTIRELPRQWSWQ